MRLTRTPSRCCSRETEKKVTHLYGDLLRQRHDSLSNAPHNSSACTACTHGTVRPDKLLAFPGTPGKLVERGFFKVGRGRFHSIACSTPWTYSSCYSAGSSSPPASGTRPPRTPRWRGRRQPPARRPWPRSRSGQLQEERQMNSVNRNSFVSFRMETKGGLQLTLSMIRLLTVGGTPLEAMHR